MFFRGGRQHSSEGAGVLAGQDSVTQNAPGTIETADLSSVTQECVNVEYSIVLNNLFCNSEC